MKKTLFLAGEKIDSLTEAHILWGFAGCEGGLSTELSTASVDCPERLL